LLLTSVGAAQELREAAVRGVPVVAIDTLRAATTAAAALAAGAVAVLPVRDVESAFALRGRLAAAVLGGERGMRPVPGFDAGNSPLEYVPTLVAGRSVVLTTTNGTLALSRARSADGVAFAALTSAHLAARWLRQRNPERALIAMSGTEGHFSFEDALTAGAIAEALPGADLDDLLLTAAAAFREQRAHLREALRGTPHGRRLIAAGYAADVAACAELGASPVLPVRDERRKARLVAWSSP